MSPSRHALSRRRQKGKMADLEQLRQEAESLKKKIRVRVQGGRGGREIKRGERQRGGEEDEEEGTMKNTLWFGAGEGW